MHLLPPNRDASTTMAMPKRRHTSRLVVDDGLMRAFTQLSGDENPIHMDDEAARRFGFEKRIAYAGALLAEVSRIISTELPGPGALCLAWNFEFKAPVHVGDAVIFETTLKHSSPATAAAVLNFKARKEDDGAVVMSGSATVKILTEEATS